MRNDTLYGGALTATLSCVGRWPGGHIPREHLDSIADHVRDLEAIRPYLETCSYRKWHETVRDLVGLAIDWFCSEERAAIVARYVSDRLSPSYARLGQRERNLHTGIFQLAVSSPFNRGSHVVLSFRMAEALLKHGFGDMTVNHNSAGRSLRALETAGFIELEVGRRSPAHTKSTVVHIPQLRPARWPHSDEMVAALALSEPIVSALEAFVAKSKEAQPAWARAHPRRTPPPERKPKERPLSAKWLEARRLKRLRSLGVDLRKLNRRLTDEEWFRLLQDVSPETQESWAAHGFSAEPDLLAGLDAESAMAEPSEELIQDHYPAPGVDDLGPEGLRDRGDDLDSGSLKDDLGAEGLQDQVPVWEEKTKNARPGGCGPAADADWSKTRRAGGTTAGRRRRKNSLGGLERAVRRAAHRGGAALTPVRGPSRRPGRWLGCYRRGSWGNPRTLGPGPLEGRGDGVRGPPSRSTSLGSNAVRTGGGGAGAGTEADRLPQYGAKD